MEGLLQPGDQLGPYQIADWLGAGGMGEVYRARDTRLGRTVAIKILRRFLHDDPHLLQRFEREARTLATLSHPHICPVFDVGQQDGVDFLVMEYLDGQTLAELLVPGPLPVKEVVAIAIQIADALEAAHDKGIVHRDLKPANIKITSGGVVKVLDFGLAKAASDEGAGAGPTQARTVEGSGTHGGLILGTVAYMSPEQASGKTVDKRTDIWAFGCVLYEMLTGRRAFEGQSVSEIRARVIEREPDWNALPPALPSRLHELVRRCLKRIRKSAGETSETCASRSSTFFPGPSARRQCLSMPHRRVARDSRGSPPPRWPLRSPSLSVVCTCPRYRIRPRPSSTSAHRRCPTPRPLRFHRRDDDSCSRRSEMDGLSST